MVDNFERTQEMLRTQARRAQQPGLQDVIGSIGEMTQRQKEIAVGKKPTSRSFNEALAARMEQRETRAREGLELEMDIFNLAERLAARGDKQAAAVVEAAKEMFPDNSEARNKMIMKADKAEETFRTKEQVKKWASKDKELREIVPLREQKLRAEIKKIGKKEEKLARVTPLRFDAEFNTRLKKQTRNFNGESFDGDELPDETQLLLRQKAQKYVRKGEGFEIAFIKAWRDLEDSGEFDTIEKVPEGFFGEAAAYVGLPAEVTNVKLVKKTTTTTKPISEMSMPEVMELLGRYEDLSSEEQTQAEQRYDVLGGK